MKEYLITVEGAVQGVGYRVFVQHQAADLGVVGYVENRAGGGVRVVAQGRERILEVLLDRLREGPRLAKVKNVVFHERPVTFDYDTFEVRHRGD